MIYNNSYFVEEMKKSYMEGAKNKGKLTIVTIALVLIAIIIHNFFTTMSDTVISDYVPQLCTYSFFAAGSIYNLVAFAFYICYFCLKYHSVTFAEMSTNRWYMLRKTGYSVNKIVLIKVFTTLVSVFVMYFCGFVLLILLGYLMNFEMQLTTLFSLSIVGIFQLLFITAFIMVLSLFIKNRTITFLFALVMAVIMAILSRVTGFYEISIDANKMQKISFVFTGLTSIYPYLLLCFAIAMTAGGSIYALSVANGYFPQTTATEDVYFLDYRTNKSIEKKLHKSINTSRLVKTIVTCVLVVLLTFSIFANVSIIVFASASSRNTNVGGYIPFVFDSQTMRGDIEKNDFVLFKVSSPSSNFEVGDIVLFYNGTEPSIKKITAVNADGTYTVDISSYPAGVEVGSEIESKKASQITAKLSEKNRWIGAWLLWNETIVGKIFTMLIPLLILVFYDKLSRIFKYLKHSLDWDESKN